MTTTKQNFSAVMDQNLQEIPILPVVVKRDGMLVPFDEKRIALALEAAFRDTKKLPTDQPLPAEVEAAVAEVTHAVIREAVKQASPKKRFSVEGIQDLVEIQLMEAGHHDVARDYILYRDHHKAVREDSPRNIKILRRDGKSVVRLNPMKIASAIERCFCNTFELEEGLPPDLIEVVNMMTAIVVENIHEEYKAGKTIDIEFIQDVIEYQMMEEGLFDVAKEYILYRAKRAEVRRNRSLEKKEKEQLETKKVESQTTATEAKVEEQQTKEETFTVKDSEGREIEIPKSKLEKTIAFACRELGGLVSPEAIVERSFANFYQGIKVEEIDKCNLMAAKAKIEEDPAYSTVAARLLLDILYREAMGVEASDPEIEAKHRTYFKEYITLSTENERVSEELKTFDLDKLADTMLLERDDQFGYLGIQTLYDRYFIHLNKRRIETPQIFWMRVAMGLCINEGEEKNERAIEFYHVLSQFLFVSGTPTLFNSGTCHPQLSSCYLSTIDDDLTHIFKVISDDAQLSKWAGGIGNDWTQVRATGAYIKGTNGESQGVIPFLKVANDTAVAVNQGGKRKGAMCAYLETWHLDVEDFLELRKNTGDERRRTHDMNTANWIPDLFMKRVVANGSWTLFSPNDVPDLHDLYGQAFEDRYHEYEKMAEEGKIKLTKKVEAVTLWRKILSMIFETGHPWVTFKDPSNIRSPQDHVGVVHSSNLCTEILLNTSPEETAVCNLGSVNLGRLVTEEGMDEKLLEKTVATAIRMLDNVIDINFYPTKEAQTANFRHRAVGLGLMGFQDALYKQGISYASPEAVEFADASMEMISYYAIYASSQLAGERGAYSTYKGSKWDRGILPVDSIALVAKERGEEFVEMDGRARMDWTKVRDSIKKQGMRNCNTMAIAPTATIANITGVTQSIEPTYKHLYVKSNLSGEFTVSNTFLVEALKERGLWDAEMIDDLKYFDGSLQEIERVPQELKELFPCAFEVEPQWIIDCGSRRQKWIDMGQSLNLYLAEPSGKKLHEMYLYAWRKGLKTTYYLRCLGATQIEKSTMDINKRGLQPRWMKNKSASSNIKVQRETEATPSAPVCNLEEGCESCQ